MTKEWIDFYKVLQVNRSASEDDIKKAYRSIVNKTHPDKLTAASSEEIKIAVEKFSNATEAYKVLKDTQKRCAYNEKYDYRQRQKLQQEQIRQQSQKRHENKSKQAADKSKEGATTYHKETSNSTETIYGNQSIADILAAYKKALYVVKQREKRNSFLRRHINYANFLEKNHPNTALLFKFPLHIGQELYFIVSKLGVKPKDDFCKYTVRNRKTFAATLSIAGVLLVNACIGGPTDTEAAFKENQETPTIVSVADNYTTTTTLTRTYKIKAGDTLSQLAEDANCKMSEIKSRNDLNSDIIQMGETINLPYHIPTNELSLFTEPKAYDINMTLAQYATQYNTTAESLFKLNEESIVKTKDSYCVISDSLMIPNFKPYQEVKNQQKIK